MERFEFLGDSFLPDKLWEIGGLAKTEAKITYQFVLGWLIHFRTVIPGVLAVVFED